MSPFFYKSTMVTPFLSYKGSVFFNHLGREEDTRLAGGLQLRPPGPGRKPPSPIGCKELVGNRAREYLRADAAVQAVIPRW